jgi:hypothetical protein
MQLVSPSNSRVAYRGSRLSLENLYRPGVSFPVKQLMYAALKDLFHYLPASKKDPTNVEYRQRLQIASWMSLWPMKLEKYRYASVNCRPEDCPLTADSTS